MCIYSTGHQAHLAGAKGPLAGHSTPARLAVFRSRNMIQAESPFRSRNIPAVSPFRSIQGCGCATGRHIHGDLGLQAIFGGWSQGWQVVTATEYSSEGSLPCQTVRILA